MFSIKIDVFVNTAEQNATALRALPRLRLGHITWYIWLISFAQILLRFTPQNFRYTRTVRRNAEFKSWAKNNGFEDFAKQYIYAERRNFNSLRG